MALNFDIIGKRYDGKPRSYTEDDVILYALGIGASVDELDFVYERNLKLFPSFAAGDISILLTMYDDFGVNLPTVLHGEQKMIFHELIPTSGTIHSSGTLSSSLR